MQAVLRHPDPFPHEVVWEIRQHAIKCFPEESCGLVVVGDDGEPEYVRSPNIHPEPTQHFTVDPEITLQYLQPVARILACVHSHPEGPNYPTYADQVMQIDSGVICGIVPVTETTTHDGAVPIAHDVLWWGDSLPVPPLSPRRFIWGIFHCWSLVRDWYRVELGIVLPNFAVAEDFIKKGESVFLDNVEKAGLTNIGKIDISELQRGDILVGHLQGDKPNHCGVYTGGDKFLHHSPDALSGEADLVRWWKHIDTVFRHAGKTASLRGTG